jgi:hypothetical protein
MALQQYQVQEFLEGVQFHANSAKDLDTAEQIAAGSYETLDDLKNACKNAASPKYAKKIV